MSISNPRQMFSNPTIPFAGTILGGLLPGEMILIQGSVPSDADRFQVDLTCGSSVKPRADVAFHFNPRFNKSCIVCNSLQAERWGREEILQQLPLKRGAPFELVLLVLEDGFKVAVNGAHVLQYKHRLDLDRVDTISISGKVKVQAVGVVPASASPAPPAVNPTNQDPEMKMIRSLSGDLSVPFRGQLLQGLTAGRSIAIKGRTNQNAHSFAVNLCVSDTSDIALHLNPRLRGHTLIRNSFLSGSWGPEETQLKTFPLRTGQYWEIIILCDAHHFRVALNGLHLLDYKHRVQDLSRIGRLEVLGDVTLMDASFL